MKESFHTDRQCCESSDVTNTITVIKTAVLGLV